MRVLLSFFESKDSQQKRTKIIDDVRTQYEAETILKKEFPNAIVSYVSSIANGADGTLFGKGMLLVS